MIYSDVIIKALKDLKKNSPSLVISTSLESVNSVYDELTLKNANTLDISPIDLVIDELKQYEIDGGLVTYRTLKVIVIDFQAEPKEKDSISFNNCKYEISRIQPIHVGSTIVAYILYLNS
jgi:hypothetical protein